MTRLYKFKEHPLMGKYSLVECRIVIPYDTIEVQYVVMGNSSYLSLFLFLYISNTTKKRVNKDFRIYKPIQITANTECEFRSILTSNHFITLITHTRTPSPLSHHIQFTHLHCRSIFYKCVDPF